MFEKARGTIASFVSFCITAMPLARAQQPARNSPVYAFEVVSIKPHASGDYSTHIDISDSHYSESNISLRSLVEFAYGLQTDDLVSGLSKPLDEARFDLEAKVDAETAAALKKLSSDEFRKQQQAMFVAMLQDRFHLKAHVESREQPVYALVVAKGGSKLKAADPNDTYPNGIKGPDGTSRAGMSSLRNGDWKAQAVSIETMIGTLERQPDVRRVVVDRTGLTGTYDFELRWSASNTLGSSDNGAADTGPSLFSALEEQLGLKLESTKAPIDSVVVTQATLPSEN